MITLLLGTDYLAKKKYISTEAKKLGAEINNYTDSSSLPAANELFEQQLFGGIKIVVLTNCWKNFDESFIEDLLRAGESKTAQLYIVEDSLDQRKKVNKEFVKDKRVILIQMDAPVGIAQSTEWIKKFVKENNFTIEPDAAQALAHALLIDEESTLDVLRAQSELAKLHTYAAQGPITKQAVTELTESATGVDVFELLNSIATKNKKLAAQMLTNYFETETTDEKGTAIKLVALLSDQFRSLLIALDANARNMPDAKVLELTGWKSGRLFIMKKLSRNFTSKQLQQALGKLENLDRELKTSSMPPHVILDLIISDM